jgi:dynactin complex subunit
MLNPEDASSEWLKKHLSQHCQLWLFDYTVKSLRLEILKQMIAYANHVTAELSQKNAILSDNITKLQKENAELHANLRRVNAGDRQAMDNRNAGDGQAMDS